MALLEVSNLDIRFATPRGELTAVQGLGFSIDAGEILAIVGESGCGKSVTAMSVLRLVPQPPGRVRGAIRLGGRDLLTLSEREMRALRGKDIGMIFQEPMTSLNPVLTIGRQIGETLRTHEGLSARDARARAVELLALVGIAEPARRVGEYPHQLSGGMRQRVMIAIALACTPRLLIADEPTTALDVTVQAQIVSLIADLLTQTRMGVIWVTHDLALLARIADRVMVMFAGHVMESASCEALFARPQHPYTRALLANLREPAQPAAATADPAPHGCPFSTRCSSAMDACRSGIPSQSEAVHGGQVACWALDP